MKWIKPMIYYPIMTVVCLYCFSITIEVIVSLYFSFVKLGYFYIEINWLNSLLIPLKGGGIVFFMTAIYILLFKSK